MNRYPQDRSVLILDNCAIHKSDTLRELVQAHGELPNYFTIIALTCSVPTGCELVFLPPYSPDFNPIEESFSCSMYSYTSIYAIIKYWPTLLVKHWMRRHWLEMVQSENPEMDLLEACGAVDAEKAKGWFAHSGYL